MILICTLFSGLFAASPAEVSPAILQLALEFLDVTDQVHSAFSHSHFRSAFSEIRLNRFMKLFHGPSPLGGIYELPRSTSLELLHSVVLQDFIKHRFPDIEAANSIFPLALTLLSEDLSELSPVSLAFLRRANVVDFSDEISASVVPLPNVLHSLTFGNLRDLALHLPALRSAYRGFPRFPINLTLEHVDLANLDFSLVSEFFSLKLRNCENVDFARLATVRSVRVGLEITGFSGEISDLVQIGNLVSLTLVMDGIFTIPDLSEFAGMTELRDLRLMNISASDLSPLGSLNKLQTLFVNLNPQLRSLRGLESLVRLRHLDVSNTAVTDIAVVARLINLERLNLSSTRIEDLSVIGELRQYNKLTHLDFANTYFTSF